MPTFGKETFESVFNTVGANFVQASGYALSEGGEVSKLTVYCTGNNVVNGSKWRGVIYDDNAGVPGDVMGSVGNEVTIAQNAPEAWVDLPFGTPIDLVAGDYWLGFIAGPEDLAARHDYDAGGAAGDYHFGEVAAYPTVEDPFVSDGNLAWLMSIYATYTVASTPADNAPFARAGRGAGW